jgi:hypothetical protein
MVDTTDLRFKSNPHWLDDYGRPTQSFYQVCLTIFTSNQPLSSQAQSHVHKILQLLFKPTVLDDMQLNSREILLDLFSNACKVLHLDQDQYVPTHKKGMMMVLRGELELATDKQERVVFDSDEEFVIENMEKGQNAVDVLTRVTAPYL